MAEVLVKNHRCCKDRACQTTPSGLIAAHFNFVIMKISKQHLNKFVERVALV